MRKSLFLSSVLLNSEAWVNYTEKDVRVLEQCEEILLSNILECDGKSSSAFKYLELGIIPIRFEIMKRKTSPPSAREAAMSAMQHETFLKHSERFLETSWNTLETFLKHSWNTLENHETSLKLPPP